MDIKDKDKGGMLIVALFISLFWLYVNSAPGIVISRLDKIFLLFGFVMPYIVMVVILRAEKKGVKD